MEIFLVDNVILFSCVEVSSQLAELGFRHTLTRFIIALLQDGMDQPDFGSHKVGQKFGNHVRGRSRETVYTALRT